MTNPAGAILDGLSIAVVHWRLVTGGILLLLASQLLLISVLHRIFGDRLAAEEYISLGLAGWLLPALLIALLWYVATFILSPYLSLLIVGLLILASLFVSMRDLPPAAGSSKTVSIALLLLALLSILLRLAFVSKAVVPLYFDSAQHYDFIHKILAAVDAQSFNLSLPGYYHLGFHFLAAFLTTLTGAEITDTMLVLGQVMLALMPFPAFFIVRHWTKSNGAAFFALALAAFGWYMPAHAVDWGKYPALTSLALIPFVITLACLYSENKRLLSRAASRGLLSLLVLGGISSLLFHSRSVIVYGLAGIAWMITWAANKVGKIAQLLLFVLFLMLLAGEVFYIRSQGILGPLLDAYGSRAILTGICVLVLAVFAWRPHPELVMFCIVSITLLLASLFVSMGTLIPGYVNTTLLDRPYVQMVLYLPLTLLAGFGLAGLEQLFQGRALKLGNSLLAWGTLVSSFFILVVIVNAWFQYDLYPADCCDIVSRDDLAAIHWIEENMPADARILTSSTDLKVLPTDQYQGSAGGDAGTWITPLSGRPVAYLPYNTDFSQPQTLQILCQQNVSYVYAGKTGWYFDDSHILSQPANYQLVLDLPKARVYRVIGCK